MNQQQHKIALRGKIFGLSESALSGRAIEQHLEVSRSTILIWFRQWEESPDLTDKARGRPARKTTPEEDQQICQAAGDNLITTVML